MRSKPIITLCSGVRSSWDIEDKKADLTASNSLTWSCSAFARKIEPIEHMAWIVDDSNGKIGPREMAWNRKLGTSPRWNGRTTCV